MTAFRWKMHEQGGLGSLFYGRFGDYRISTISADPYWYALWHRPHNGPRRGTYVLLQDCFATTQEAIDVAVAHYKSLHKARKGKRRKPHDIGST